MRVELPAGQTRDHVSGREFDVGRGSDRQHDLRPTTLEEFSQLQDVASVSAGESDALDAGTHKVLVVWRFEIDDQRDLMPRGAQCARQQRRNPFSAAADQGRHIDRNAAASASIWTRNRRIRLAAALPLGSDKHAHQLHSQPPPRATRCARDVQHIDLAPSRRAPKPKQREAEYDGSKKDAAVATGDQPLDDDVGFRRSRHHVDQHIVHAIDAAAAAEAVRCGNEYPQRRLLSCHSFQGPSAKLFRAAIRRRQLQSCRRRRGRGPASFIRAFQKRNGTNRLVCCIYS